MIKAFIFPTYNEVETIPLLLGKLLPGLQSKDIVIIADDSKREVQRKIQGLVEDNKQIEFLPGKEKGGRGAAVHRSIVWILQKRPDVTHVIEADCDGSHRVEDILKIANSEEDLDFVVGSRYLKESKIIGWSISRRVMSRILNTLIPVILDVEIKDITNGLRRYSKNACQEIVRADLIVEGFVYLSEQAVRLRHVGIFPREIPIIFESRIAGESSVDLLDLLKSFKGLLSLIKHKSKFHPSKNK